MNKRQKKPSKSRANPQTGSQDREETNEPLVGREPNNPPRKNVLFLTFSIAAFAIWSGFLSWLAWQTLK